MKLKYLKSIFLALLFYHTYAYSVDFVLFTEPKTGTHLIINILSKLTNKQVYWAQEYRDKTPPFQGNDDTDLKNPKLLFFAVNLAPWDKSIMDKVWEINKNNGTFLHLHAPYSDSMNNYLSKKKVVNFFVKRDPRDTIVSLLNHYKHINFNDKSIEMISSDDERLLVMIRKQLRKTTLQFMGWQTSPMCCVLDFKKLMGAHGGAATHAEAMDEMRKITRELKLKRSNKTLEKIYTESFGCGWSFFKGKVGSWKDYFNEEHKAAVKEEIGDLLIKLGYEQDYNW